MTEAIKMFTLRQMAERDWEDAGFDRWHERQLVLTAYDEGYGVVERIKKSSMPSRDAYHYGADNSMVEVEYKAMGLKLHE